MWQQDAASPLDDIPQMVPARPGQWLGAVTQTHLHTGPGNPEGQEQHPPSVSQLRTALDIGDTPQHLPSQEPGGVKETRVRQGARPHGWCRHRTFQELLRLTQTRMGRQEAFASTMLLESHQVGPLWGVLSRLRLMFCPGQFSPPSGNFRLSCCTPTQSCPWDSREQASNEHSKVSNASEMEEKQELGNGGKQELKV